jgi:paraquat-inducible protein B
MALYELIAILWTPWALVGAWLLFQHIRERGAK